MPDGSIHGRKSDKVISEERNILVIVTKYYFPANWDFASCFGFVEKVLK